MSNPRKLKKEMRKSKKRVTTWLSADVLCLLRQEAMSRYVSQQNIIESSLREHLVPSDEEGQFALLLRRVTRIDSKLKAIDRAIEILAETLALYIRTWLAYTDEVPESKREEMHFKAQRRFEKFLLNLSKRIEVGQSLFSDLSKDAVVKESK